MARRITGHKIVDNIIDGTIDPAEDEVKEHHSNNMGYIGKSNYQLNNLIQNIEKKIIENKDLQSLLNKNEQVVY